MDTFQSSIPHLQELLSSLELHFPDDQLTSCLKHLALVIEKNKIMNLTRITSLEDALILHVVDSLALTPYVDESPYGPCLDMGTGAGFPGIPLAIVLDRSFTLLDSVGKKVTAVQEFSHELGLSNVTAVHDRLETFALQASEHFSCVVARAVASLPVLIEYATPFLQYGGRLVLTKGTPDQEEISSGLSAVEICGLTFIESSTFDLPCDMGHRSVFVFERSRKPRIKLPRTNGMARKQPLA